MYTTIDACVRSAIADKGYFTLHRYILYLHFALEGIYKAKRDSAFSSLKKIKLKVNSRNAIKWPDDYLCFKKVGLPIGNRLLTFVPDQSISLFEDDHKADGQANFTNTGFPLSSAMISDDMSFLEFTNLYLSNDLAMLRGGAGSYLARHFRVNNEAREFQMDSTLVGLGSIFLEYVATGSKPCSQTIISHHAGLLTKEHIHYREARFKFGAAAAETRASEQDYLDALDESLAAQSDVSMNGILDALSQSTRFTILQ